MIRRQTTFVIGAGASHSYNLPTAQELLEKARAVDEGSAIYRLVVEALPSIDSRDADVEPSLPLDALLHAVRQDRTATSIDTVLASRKQNFHVQTAGRALIAALMGQAIYDK